MLTKEEGSPYMAKNFKICDFGLATSEDVEDYLYKRCGTPGYVSPEIVKADADDKSFRATTKCDAFSAGVILYLLLSSLLSSSRQHAVPVVRHEGDLDQDRGVQGELRAQAAGQAFARE